MNKLMRLDKLVTKKFPQFSRSKIQKMIEGGLVLVNGVIAGQSNFMAAEDANIILNDSVFDKIAQKRVISSAAKRVRILYEDKACMVVDKPALMSVHPGNVNYGQFTVVDSVIGKLSKSFKDKLRPGIVHRLDKDTSGVLIIAKTPMSAEKIMEQFKKRKVHKVYTALVCGVLQHSEGVIDSPIIRSVRHRKKMSLGKDGIGRNAISKYRTKKIIRINTKYQVSLLEVEIMTGRTHQIRVHMAALGHPIIGDGVYGNRSINKLFERKFSLMRQFLHAREIEFVSPATKKEVKVESPLASDLTNVYSLITQL